MSWLRVEGASQDPDLTEGLQARIADPLWALARQWQVGEFHGEDAASPVLVSAEVEWAPLSAFAPGPAGSPAPPLQREDADRPLEVLAEEEAVDDDVRLTLDVGWALLRALQRAGVPAAVLGHLRTRYRVGLAADDARDPSGRAELELVAARSLDGLRLARELVPDTTRAALLQALGLTSVEPLMTRWLTSANEMVRTPTAKSPGSWQDASLEYRFRVAAGTGADEVTLEAAEYRGGTLDWYHFEDATPAEPLGTGEPFTRRVVTTLPAPLRFNGMPAARFWAIEDEAVSFGDLAAGPQDVVRAIIGGFAAVYGNDWLRVPFRVPVGSVARVVELTVLDDYGERHVIPAAATLDGPARAWRFFELGDDRGPNGLLPGQRGAPLLLLAPALPDVEAGPAIERVDLIQDGVANLAWGIERRARAASGRPIDRDTQAASSPAAPTGDDWTYLALTPVPENWIPFVPVSSDSGRSAQLRLRRGRMAVGPDGVPPEQLLPLGRLLDARAPMRVQAAAIPDGGLRIERRYQRARSADGRIHLWVGRRVQSGAAPAASRYTTDRLQQPPQPAD